MADVYDALTSDRVYSKKVKEDVAIKHILNNIGTHFDFDITKKFILAMGCYPRNLRVSLSTGDYGIVIGHTKKSPVVKILVDSTRNKVEGYYEIDLSKNPSVFITDVDPVIQPTVKNIEMDKVTNLNLVK